jgi:hypothetical protein
MNQTLLKRVTQLTLCMCLALALFATLTIAKPAHAATTSSASCSDLYMSPGTVFLPGDYAYNYTCSGTLIKLIYQGDGNFVLYIGGVAKWASNTSSFFYLTSDVRFQPDGNLVVYHVNSLNGSRTPGWASNTAGKGATTLSLQHDGNLVIYNGAGKALWSTNTCCYS